MTNITKKQEALLNELLKDFNGDAEDLLGKHGLVMELKKRGLEAMLEGELVPQNPDDESASLLLARINADLYQHQARRNASQTRLPQISLFIELQAIHFGIPG